MFRLLPVMQSVTFQKITAVIDMTQIISDLSQMRDLEGDQVDVRIHVLSATTHNLFWTRRIHHAVS